MVRVNGSIVFIDVSVNGTIHADESGSEQCEGCGLDILETGRVLGTATTGDYRVVCDRCGTWYPVQYAERVDY